MMLKFIVLFCIFACVFSFDIALKNKKLNAYCSVHLKYDAVNPENSLEYFAVFNKNPTNPELRIAKLIYADGTVETLRCDVSNGEGECYKNSYKRVENVSFTCNDGWASPSSFDLDVYPVSSEYVYGEYPKPAECPDGHSQDCNQYCDSDSKCIIVDSEGRFVQEKDGSNWTFYDPPTMDVFEVYKCDPTLDNRFLSAPSNLCEPGAFKEIKNAEVSCTFHVEQLNKDGIIYADHYGIAVGDKPLVLKTIYELYDLYYLYRCDIPEVSENCYFKRAYISAPTTCEQDPEYYYINFWPIGPESFKYYFLDYPKPVDCPTNSSQGCQKYCEDYLEKHCIIVDDAGHFVEDDKGYRYIYHEKPSLDMNMFKDTNCDDSSIELPIPLDYCSVMKKLTPKYPEGKFLIESGYYKASGVIVEGSLLMFDVKSENRNYTMRCDIPSIAGNCYWKTADYNYGYEEVECKSGYDIGVESLVLSYAPEEFSYNTSAYPIDAECPDGTNCKKYCNLYGECAFINAAGYVVRFGDPYVDMNLTFTDDCSVDEFDIESCDNFVVPPPPADPCRPIDPSSSSSSSSGKPAVKTSSLSSSSSSNSTSTKPSSSSTSPAKTSSSASSPAKVSSSTSPAPAKSSVSPSGIHISSASILNVAFAIFAICIAISLL